MERQRCLMPWKCRTVIDSRQAFVRLAEQGNVSVAELCRRFGIGRETGYLYLRRYRAEGTDSLRKRSVLPVGAGKGRAVWAKPGPGRDVSLGRDCATHLAATASYGSPPDGRSASGMCPVP